MQNEAELRRGIAAGLGAYLLWGFLTVYWKALGDFDPFELIGWRVVCSAATKGRAHHGSRASRTGALRSRRAGSWAAAGRAHCSA